MRHPLKGVWFEVPNAVVGLYRVQITFDRGRDVKPVKVAVKSVRASLIRLLCRLVADGEWDMYMNTGRPGFGFLRHASTYVEKEER